MNDNKDVVCAGQSCNVKEIIFAWKSWVNLL
jgi:hypothetical protein